jgi:hypothetical protein
MGSIDIIDIIGTVDTFGLVRLMVLFDLRPQNLEDDVREDAALTDGSTAVRSATTLQMACRTLAQQCLLVTYIMPSPDPGRPQALASKDS